MVRTIYAESAIVLVSLTCINPHAELGALRLVTLSMSDNQITNLPIEMRAIDSLMNLSLENNPFVFPPPNVCVGVGMSHIVLPLQRIPLDILTTLYYRIVCDIPCQVCARGRVHIFRFLTGEAEKQFHEQHNPHLDGRGFDTSFRTSQLVCRDHAHLHPTYSHPAVR